MATPYNILVEVSPLDGGTPVTLRLASLDADSTAVSANGQSWLPCINVLPKQRVELSADGILGDIKISRGEVGFVVSPEFQNGEWTAYTWSGAFCQIWVGPKGGQWADYIKYFEGKVSSLERSGIDANFKLLGPEADLTNTILSLEYAGTGDEEGPAGLKGVAKPRCYGSPRSVEPVEIDPIHLVYQVHAYGPVQSILPYEFGSPLLTSQNVGDTGSYDALCALTLEPGEYATCLAQGMFRFGGTPTPKVSADVVMPSGSTLPEIAESVLLDAGIPSSSIGDFSAFAGIQTDRFINDETKALDLLFGLFKEAGGYAYPDSNGVWQCGKFYQSSRAPVVLASDRSSFPVLLNWKLEASQAPLWRVKYGYERCWGVHADGDASPLINELAADLSATQDSADEAQNKADAAVAAAQLATNAIDSFLSDDKLDASEKKRIVALLAEYTAQKPLYEAQADLFDVTTEKTDYQNAYTVLVTYLDGLAPAYDDFTASTTIVRSEFMEKFEGFTTSLTNLLLRIATLARTAWQGEWDSQSTYARNDGVVYQGRAFVSAIDDNTGNAPPSTATSNDNWTLLADRGAAGPTLSITPSKAGFTYLDGNPNPASQTITLTAKVEGSATAVNWTTVPNIKSQAGSSTFSVSLADIGANEQVVVTAIYDGTIASSFALVKLADSSATVGAPPGTPLGSQLVEQFEADYAAAKNDIADLFTTYGDTASAATSANLAEQYKIAAEQIEQAVNDAKDDAESAASTATTQAGITVSARDQAVNSAETTGPERTDANLNYFVRYDGDPLSTFSSASAVLFEGGYAISMTPGNNNSVALQSKLYPAVAGRVYEVEVEYYCHTKATNNVFVRHQMKSVNAAGVHDGTDFGGAHQFTASGQRVTLVERWSNVASGNIRAWPAGAVNLRFGGSPYNGPGGLVYMKRIRVVDVTSQLASEASANASAQSASIATSAVTEAGEHASAADLDRIAAQTAKNDAEGILVQTVDAKEDAEGAASTATQQAGISASSSNSSRLAALSQYSTSTASINDWTNNNAHDVRDPLAPGDPYYFTGIVNDPDLGPSLGQTQLQGASPRASMPCIPGRKYRFRASVKFMTGTNTKIRLLVYPVTASNGSAGGSTSIYSDVGVAANGIATIDTVLDCSTYLAAHPTIEYFKLLPIGSGDGASGASRMGKVFIEDVTESETSKAFANASAQSAATATSAVTETSQHAAAADLDRIAAQTAKTDAEGILLQTVEAKEDAEGAASTATQQAGIVVSTASGLAGTIGLTPNAQFTAGGQGWDYHTSVTHQTDWNGAPHALVAPDSGNYNLTPTAFSSFKAGRTYKITLEMYDPEAGRSHNLRLYRENGSLWSTLETFNLGGVSDWVTFERNVIPNVDEVARPWLVFSRYGDDPITPVGIRRFSLEDITESKAAESSATAAATSEANAAAHVNTAGQHSATASQQAGIAVEAKNESVAAAGVSTDQAAIATSEAAAAQSSATIAASVGQGSLNANPTFSTWGSASGAPDGWTVWSTPSALTRVDVDGISPYAAEFTVSSSISGGMYQSWVAGSNDLSEVAPGWYVLEAAFMRIHGSMEGAGLYFPAHDANGSIVQSNNTVRRSIGEIMGTQYPPMNIVHRISTLVEITHSTAKQALLYTMANWNGFSGENLASKTIRWYGVKARKATEAEVAAQTALPALEASVSSQASTLATLDSQMADLEDTVSTQGATVTQNATTLSNLQGDYASLSSTVSTQGVTISQQATALNNTEDDVSTLMGKVGLKVDVNGRIAGLDIFNSGTTSEVKFHADSFKIEKPGGGQRTEYSNGNWRVYDANGVLRGRWGIW